MRLSWNEIRTRAAAFSREWADATYEKGETQSFYNEFFEIFGKRRRDVARYEERVQRLDMVVADRAYLDFGWLHQLQQRGVTFVTRLKRNVRYQVVREHDVDIRTGVLSDQTIELTSARSRKAYPGTLRRVGYWDEETRRSYVFVTNNTTWVGKTIANLYKSRWQIELFFKWIKQHLKVKRFVGRTKNAVLSQLWVATCMYLLLAYLKFVLRLSWSLHQMLRVLQLNLFDRRPLVELFTTPSPPGSPDPQMLLWR